MQDTKYLEIIKAPVITEKSETKPNIQNDCVRKSDGIVGNDSVAFVNKSIFRSQTNRMNKQSE